ncbi:MAG: hypothetical protein O3A81_04750 [bacterium]|nr:hypothetical protein [bacterium]
MSEYDKETETDGTPKVSLQQQQVADVANHLIKNAQTRGASSITLPNGATVDLHLSGRGSVKALVVSFLPAKGETYGPKILLDLAHPHEKSQLLVPPPEDSLKDTRYSVGTPSPAALAQRVDKILALIVLELQRQQTAQVDAIQEEVSNHDAILNALEL